MATYCTTADVQLCEQLKIGDWTSANLTIVITRMSQYMDDHGVGGTTETHKLLCQLLCWYYILWFFPTAYAEGEMKFSRVGQLSRWKREIIGLINDFRGTTTLKG